MAAVLLLTMAACRGDDGGAEPEADDGGFPAAGPAAGSTTPGLIVGQQSVDGRLGDVVVAVDPATGETTDVPVAAIGLASGVAAGPGRVFYVSGATNVLVDLTTATVEDLGLSSEEYLPTIARLTGGVGDRYAVLTASSGAGAVLVDLTTAEVTDLTDQLADGLYVTGELRPDEAVALIGGQDVSYAVPTADPAAVAPVGDGFGQLLGDGGSVVLTAPGGASVIDLASDESRTLTDTMTGAVPVGDLVLLQTSETEAALVDPASGDTLQTLSLGADASSPVRADDAVLLSTDANQDWQLIDGTDGTVTPLPDLAGYLEQPSPTGEGRWVVFRATDQGRPVVGVDTGDGGVQPIAALPAGERFTSIAAMAPDGPWMVAATDSSSPDGTAVTRGRLINLDTGVTVDLGPRFQGAAFSPDGQQVAWSSGDAAELQVAPVEDLRAAALVATGIVVPIWLPA